jgi:hypothetical protein
MRYDFLLYGVQKSDLVEIGNLDLDRVSLHSENKEGLRPVASTSD